MTALKDAGPKVYQQMNEKIIAGTAAAKDYDAAILSLQRRMRADQGILANNPNFGPDTDKGREKAQRVADTQQEIARLQELKKATEETGKIEARRYAEVRQARLLALAASKQAAAQEAAAASIGAASQLSVGTSIRQTIKATMDYAAAMAIAKQAQIEMNNVSPPVSFFDRLKSSAAATQVAVTRLWAAMNSPALGGLEKARVAMFGLSTAAKAAGAAFLAVIPIIGQLTLAISFIQMGIDYLTPDSVKKLRKAFEEFTEVAESTDKSIAALNRTQTSTASLALRTQQAIIIQSNAIATLADSYDALIRKQEELGKGGDRGNAVAGFLETFNSNNFASYALNISKTSKALQLFENDLPTIFSPTGGVDKDPILSGAIVAMDKLRKLAPEATEKAIMFAGGWEKLSKLPLEQKLGVINKIVSSVNNQYKDAAERATSLAEAFKNLNQAIGDFALSQQQSTPFDAVVKNFQAVNNGIREFQATASRNANIDADQYKGMLSSLGSNVEAFLTVGTNEQLKRFREINDQVQEIEAARARGAPINERQLQSLKMQRDSQSGVLDAVDQELRVRQKTFELAQEQDRVLKSQLTTLQAHLTANQANFAATASGVKARMEGENRLKQLQISQLQVQKGIIEAYIAQNRAQIEGLKGQIEMIKAGYDFNRVIDEGNIMLRQRAANLRVQAAEMRLSARDINPAEVTMSTGLADAARKQLGADSKLVDDYIKATTEANKLNEMSSAYQAIEKAEQAVKGYESSISSLINQINALAISQNTSGQIAAESAAKRAEIINQQTDQLKQQYQTLQSIQTLERATNRILEGRSETIADQLKDILANANAQKLALKNDNDNTLRTLRSELAKARADSAVANDPAAQQANRDRISLLQEQVRLEEQGYRVNLQRIDAETRNAIVQKAAFDVQVEGLQMQQNALSYVDKQLQTRRELLDTVREQSNIERDIVRRSRGYAQTPDSKMSDEILAARAVYDYAVDEAQLRRATIKLEYALLDAQRQTQLNNLQAQRNVLAQTEGANSVMVRQLDATIDGLSRASGLINQAQSDALRLVDRQMEVAYRKLQQAALPEGTNSPTISQFRKDRDERIALQREVLSGSMKRTSGDAINPVIAPMVKATTDSVASIGALTQVNEQLVIIGRQLVDKQKGQESGTNSTLSRIPMRTIQDAAATAIAQGFRVSEMRGYGGVTPGAHRGQGHGAGRAFDLNIGTGNVEANNPAMRARMDKIADQFRREGYTVLWKVKGHYDHMHVEVGKAMQAAVQRQVRVVENTAQVAESKIADIAIPQPTAANDNAPNSDIVVTGKYAPDTKPGDQVRSPASSELLDTFKFIMSKEGSISEVFEKMAGDLGPQGTIIPTILQGIESIGDTYLRMKDILSDPNATFGDKFQGVASVAQQALGTIQSVLAAGAAAKEDAIQREITAEQRRDGKSAESLAKIQALEKKKDEIAKKQFNTNKKLQMAQAVIATAAGVAQALAYGPFVGPILAGVIAAMGAAQIAIISGTQYQSSASTAAATATPPSLTIGKRGDTVDLAKNNQNLGGELGYLRGTPGRGSNASNYSIVGSAYGGDLPRGYGNTAYVVGEKGPETITPETPVTVRPANDNTNGSSPIDATFNIRALDARGVEEVLVEQRGNIISMLREAANASGQRFLEDVDVNVYNRPNVSRL